MTATGSRPLDSLPPESKAMLSLLLVQGRSYQQIAEMLHMSPDDVRGRAHTAAELLVGGSDDRLSPAGRSRIIDYLLGEQSVSERELTRSELTSLDASREWAQRLSASLATLAKEPLPSIPGTEAEAEAEAVVAVAAQPVAEEPEPVAEEPEPVAEEPQPVAEEPEPAATTTPVPAAAPAPEAGKAEDRRSRSRTSWILVAVLIAIVAIVAIVIVAANGGKSTPHQASTGVIVTPPPGGKTKGPVKTVRRLYLIGSSGGNKALGEGVVVSQHGNLLLLLQARGLAANHHTSYGVWLYNSPTDARLLGFVSPPVGPAGTFSSSVALPGDAVRFHSLIVTLEQSNLPKRPGPTVLRSPLSLP